MKSIILIGMPGVGKSSIGVILAKTLGMRFVDSDLVIQEKYGKRLKDLIGELGPEKFLELENDMNLTIHDENAVIATGGSAVYGTGAMEHYKKLGTVLYLRIGKFDLRKRLGDLDERGVVHKPGQGLDEIYNERKVLYEKYADVTVTERGNMNISATISKIHETLRENGLI